MTRNRDIRRRVSFDTVADLYDRVRPGYPDSLIDDLAAAAGVDRACRVLEIGCGTGQLTVPLAARGARILAVELGENLAAIARRKLARFDLVDLVVANFDDWSPPVEPFDLVVAATAFHWLDSTTRVENCAKAVRPGGLLAIVETHWGGGSTRDPFSVESRACYARWDPDHSGSTAPFEPPETLEELEKSPWFETIPLRTYGAERTYGASEYRDLLGTFSDVLALAPAARSGLLGCLTGLIDSRFGGRIVRNDRYNLRLARRSG